MKISALAVATALAFTTGALVHVAPAHAEGYEDLPGLTSVSDVLVDTTHGRVWIAGSGLLAADLSGHVIGSVPGVTNVNQVAMSPDGTQLIAAAGNGLTVVDPATRTVVRSIPTGEGSCPGGVASASGLVFYTYGLCASGTPVLGAVNLATDDLTQGINIGFGPGEFYSQVRLESTPADPDLLVAVQMDQLAVIDTANGETPTATVRASKTNYIFWDAAIAPDANSILVAASSTQLKRFSAADLTVLSTRTVGTAGSADAIAVRADGMTAVGAEGYTQGGSDFKVFTGDDPTPVRSVDFGGSNSVVRNAVAFGPALAYVATKNSQGAFRLRTLIAGPSTKVVLTTDKNSYPVGTTATVAARLASVTTDRTVSIWATPHGQARRLIKTAVVSPTTDKLVVKYRMVRNTTFDATFAGDDTHAPGTAKKAVTVPAKVTITSSSKSTDGSYHRLPAATVNALSGLLSPAGTPGCVSSTGQQLIGGQWRTIGKIDCVKVSSTGHFQIGLRGFRKGDRFRAAVKFNGGAWNTASVTVWYYVVFT